MCACLRSEVMAPQNLPESLFDFAHSDNDFCNRPTCPAPNSFSGLSDEEVSDNRIKHVWIRMYFDRKISLLVLVICSTSTSCNLDGVARSASARKRQKCYANLELAQAEVSLLLQRRGGSIANISLPSEHQGCHDNGYSIVLLTNKHFLVCCTNSAPSIMSLQTFLDDVDTLGAHDGEILGVLSNGMPIQICLDDSKEEIKAQLESELKQKLHLEEIIGRD